MSTDRTCRMSDLRHLRSELMYSIDQAEHNAKQAMSTAESMRRTHAEVQRRTDQLAGDVNQVRGVVHDLHIQQELDHDRIARNEAAGERLRRDIRRIEAQTDANQADIQKMHGYLQTIEQDIQETNGRIAENERRIGSLQTVMAQLDQSIQRESAERQKLREDVTRQFAQQEAQIHNLGDRLDKDIELRRRIAEQQHSLVLAQSAQTDVLLKLIEETKVNRFDCQTGYQLAVTKHRQAHSSLTSQLDQTAYAQFQDSQLEYEGVLRQITQREAAFDAARARLDSAVRRLEAEFESLDLENMQRLMHHEYKTLKATVDDLKASADRRDYEQVSTHAARLEWMSRLTHQSDEARALCDQRRTQLAETVRQVQDRLFKMQMIIDVLEERWASDNPILAEYADTSDPTSMIVLRTQRPANMPNATVFMERDGTVKFSWTGYQGMECAKDADEMEHILEEKHQMRVHVDKYEDVPSRPNPPSGGGSRPPIPRQPEAEATRKQQSTRG